MVDVSEGRLAVHEKYKALMKAKIEELSVETEMDLAMLTAEHISRDTKAGTPLSSSITTNLNIELQNTELAAEKRLAQTQTTIDHLSREIALSVCEHDGYDSFAKIAAQFSKNFETVVSKYTAYTDLLKFSEKQVLSRGVTQVSWLDWLCSRIDIVIELCLRLNDGNRNFHMRGDRIKCLVISFMIVFPFPFLKIAL